VKNITANESGARMTTPTKKSPADTETHFLNISLCITFLLSKIRFLPGVCGKPALRLVNAGACGLRRRQHDNADLTQVRGKPKGDWGGHFGKSGSGIQ
jgi:hypothetical protein